MALRVAVHRLLDGAARVCSSASRALHAAAAGCARLEDVRTAVTREWNEQPGVAVESYVTSGLFEWEEDACGRTLRAGDRVLVVGCGTGRDLLALGERGWRVDGLDVAPRCTAFARAMLLGRGVAADVHTGAVEDVELDDRYDVVVFSWFCYCYIPVSARRVAVLRRVRRWLRPGGRIVISYIARDRARRWRPVAITRAIATLLRSDWRPEDGDVLSPAGAGRFFGHYEHQFDDDEIEAEARAAGFHVACRGTGASERWIVLAPEGGARA